MINMRTDGVGGNLRIQYLTRLLVTLRIKSSLVTLVLKVLRDGAPGHPLALCMPPYCSTVDFFYLFCSPASRLLWMLSLLPGRLFPQLFAWLVLIHISGLRINVSFNILEISSTSLPFQKKRENLSHSSFCLYLHCYCHGPELDLLWSRLQSFVYSCLLISSPCSVFHAAARFIFN